MVLRGLRRLALAAALTVAAAPLYAQQPDEIKALEQRLERLLEEATAIRAELDKIKGAPPPGDLTAIDVVSAAPVEQAAAPPPVTSKIFNPDISVIGTVAGAAGDSNTFEYGPDQTRPAVDLQEVEMALEAFVDPYAKGKFFLAIGHEGIEVEEAYADFIALPWDLSAKAGKKKALFGKANTFHTHIRPWIDQPLVIHNFFGDEGLSDTGLSVSRIFPTGTVFTELTAEVSSGNAEGVFERRNRNDLFYNTHLRLFRDLSENSNIEVGTSLARGTAPESGVKSQFAGVDVSYRWKPLQQGLYRGFIGRVEAIVNDRDDLEDRRSGFYASAEWQAAQRWIVGARLDQASSPFSSGDDRGGSLLLTFRPSEFSQLRGQLRRTSYGDEDAVTELLLQLQFSIGAHGAHTF